MKNNKKINIYDLSSQNVKKQNKYNKNNRIDLYDLSSQVIKNNKKIDIYDLSSQTKRIK